MDKKIFRASNIQEALAKIKEEMGRDAMILSTRKIPRKPLDPYAKDMFEVEAGISVKGAGKSDPAGKREGGVKGSETDKNESGLFESLKGDISEIRDMIAIAGFGSGIQNILCSHFESVGVLASFLRAGVSDRLAISLIEKSLDPMVAGLVQGERI
jgi:flagellar biosynthesis protein FlhF